MSFSRKQFLKTAALGLGASSVPKLTTGLFPQCHPIIKPAQLRKGDVLGLISPASSLSSDERYEEVAENIKAMGFNVKIGIHAKDDYGYLAGTDVARAEDLNTMFLDPDIDAILPFRGGWGAGRILEYIDYEVIRNNPKPLIGFSDITSLLLAIYAKTGLVTFHGPVGKSEWTSFTQSYFQKALMQPKPFAVQNKEESKITVIREGVAEGTLLGGNLTVLTSILGSGYLPDWNQSILFLEDVGEDIYRIDRMLTQLRLNGIFDQINGLIFGKCSNCSVREGNHFTLEQVLNQHIQDYDFPVTSGVEIGHVEDMFTLPIGIPARMNTSDAAVYVLEAPVKPSV